MTRALQPSLWPLLPRLWISKVTMTDETPDNVINLNDAKQSISELARLDPISYGQQRKAAAKKLGIPIGTLDKEVQKRRRIPAENVNKNLILSDRGAIVPILANAIEVLAQGAEIWKLRFEEFSQRAFLGNKPLEDADLLQIAEWIQRQGCHAGKRVTDDAIIHTAHRQRFHVVRDWLSALEWDGMSRIDTMLIDHAGAQDSELVRAFTSKFLLQATARIFDPGCQADATLVLEGPQGAGKSSLLRVLFGDEWFADHLPNLDSKDAQIQLLGIWCIELSELAALSGKENAKTKQFLSSRDDRFRLPFDRVAKNHPRSSVFAGTVNPGASGYLKDETGGRRYWPVILGEVDIGQVAANREQYWAEAVARYDAKEIWHLGSGDVADQARESQSDRYVGDPWQEVIETWLKEQPIKRGHKFKFVTLPEIFTHCLSIPLKADWDQMKQNRVVRCLSHLGWERWQKRATKDEIATGSQPREWGYRARVTTSEAPSTQVNEAENWERDHE